MFESRQTSAVTCTGSPYWLTGDSSALNSQITVFLADMSMSACEVSLRSVATGVLWLV